MPDEPVLSWNSHDYRSSDRSGLEGIGKLLDTNDMTETSGLVLFVSIPIHIRTHDPPILT